MLIDNGGVSCVAVKDCDLCGGAGVVLYDALVDNEFSAPGVWEELHCTNPNCGLIWINPRPSKGDEIGKLYTDYWTHASPINLPKDTDPLSIRVINYMSVLIRTTLKFLASVFFFWRSMSYRTQNGYLQGLRPGRLLDIGCGSGTFLRHMATQGWSAHGLDFDFEAINVANKMKGVDARVGDLFSQNFEGNYFDAITMNNVIEHLPNPQDTVDECFRILKNNGRLVIITPNSGSIGHFLFGEYWRGLEVPRHLFIFNRRTIRRIARTSGFERIYNFTTPGSSAATEYIWSQSKKNSKLKTARPAGLSVRASRILEKALDVIGLSKGEWLVMIAIR